MRMRGFVVSLVQVGTTVTRWVSSFTWHMLNAGEVWFLWSVAHNVVIRWNRELASAEGWLWTEELHLTMWAIAVASLECILSAWPAQLKDCSPIVRDAGRSFQEILRRKLSHFWFKLVQLAVFVYLWHKWDLLVGAEVSAGLFQISAGQSKCFPACMLPPAFGNTHWHLL